MHERLPLPVQPLLDHYRIQVQRALPDLVTGFYVVGSIALDGFNPRFSDIDFVGVLGRPAARFELAELQKIHQATEAVETRWKMAGSYVQQGDLGCFDEEAAPHPYYDRGRLHAAGHFEVNAVTWWILKNHGVALWGPEPQTLPFVVDWELLVARMRENLHSYWAHWARSPAQRLVLLTDWGIQWSVLGVLRQFYSFREGAITTKEKAGAYALASLPVGWHPVVWEALRIRTGGRSPTYRSRWVRAGDAIGLLNYILQRC